MDEMISTVLVITNKAVIFYVAGRWREPTNIENKWEAYTYVLTSIMELVCKNK